MYRNISTTRGFPTTKKAWPLKGGREQEHRKCASRGSTLGGHTQRPLKAAAASQNIPVKASKSMGAINWPESSGKVFDVPRNIFLKAVKSMRFYVIWVNVVHLPNGSFYSIGAISPI